MPNSQGTLRVRTLTAGSALPVEGSIVRILGADENNRLIAHSLVTDNDGLTKAVALPTPDISYSLSPSSEEMPYSTYDVEVTATGYFPRKIFGVSVFSGINSIQPIAMIPISRDNEQNYPIGNLNATVTQNERLE